ncbi:MAG: ABC transporter permease [Acidobacteriota bacterium]
MTTLRYALDEALRSLGRRGRSALMSMGTIAIAFLTLGGFLLVSANLQRVVARWAEAAELSVYLADEIAEDDRAALEATLREHAAVVAVEFVSKEQALQRFSADFPELADVPATLDGNPFPASFEVRLRTDPVAAGAADALAASLAERDGVADVQYDRRWLSRVMAAVTAAQIVGLLVAGILVAGAAFTVAAVVRLSLAARQDELEIMRLVGAPFTMIRGPFVAEGALQGLAGSVVALAVLAGVFAIVEGRFGSDFAGFLGAGELRFLDAREAAGMVGAGLTVGLLAGALASRAARGR